MSEEKPVWGASTWADLHSALDGAHELSGPPHERIAELIRQRDALREQVNKITAEQEREVLAARVEFELWARKQPKHVIKDLQRYSDDWHDKELAGKYGHIDTQSAWEAWQESWTSATKRWNAAYPMKEFLRIRLERDVFRAVLEGQEFPTLDELPDHEEPIAFARRVGELAKQVTVERFEMLDNLLGVRK